MSDKRAYLLVNLALLLWATNVTLGRALRNDIGPVTLTAGRSLVAGILFLFLLWRRPVAERRLRGDGRVLMAMSLTGIVIFVPFLYLGLHYTTAVNGALINAVTPLLTAVLASLLIKEPLSHSRVMGTVISLAGVAVIISDGSLAVLRELRFNPGDVILVADMTLWALYSVLGRIVMRHRSALSATALPIWMGLPLLWGAAVLEWRVMPPTLSWDVLGAVVYIGMFPAGVSFLAWNAGVRRLGPGRAMAFYNTLPFFGALLAILLLGEQLHLSHLVGGVLVIGGGLLGVR